MSPLSLAIGGALLVVLVGVTLVLGRSTRGNSAGITTSRAGRVVTLTRLSLGALRRRLSRAVGRVFLSRAKREVRDRAIEAEAAREIATAMGDMKGVLMKLGQIISFMDDAVPEAYRVELAKLQSQAGNYLFLGGGRVAFLDFGCVKRFQPEFVEALRSLNRLYLIGDRDGYRAKMIEMRYILPSVAEKVTAEWLWEYMHYYYLPIVVDEPFTMTAEHTRKAIDAMFGPAMRKLNMPGEFVLLNRINFGLNSIFARLGSRENFHRLARRYFFKEGDVEKYDAAHRAGERATPGANGSSPHSGAGTS